ncbi:MAG: hypothetical protein AB1938_06810 [Myxococcota bacterium]
MPGRTTEGPLRLGTRFALDGELEAAFARADEYLRAAGYRLSGPTAGQVIATRGQSVLNLVAFSPRWWNVEVRVEAQRRGGRLEVTTLFLVDTRAQMPSVSECAFWRAEVLGLEKAMREGAVSVEENHRLARRSLLMNSLAFPVLLAVSGAPAGLVAAWFDDAPQRTGPFLAAMLAAGAAGLALAWWVGRVVFGIFSGTEQLPYAPE